MTTKLSVDDLPDIWSRLRDGWTRVRIAERYGVSETSVRRFLRRHGGQQISATHPYALNTTPPDDRDVL